jgi:hypothetical protein
MKFLSDMNTAEMAEENMLGGALISITGAGLTWYTGSFWSLAMTLFGIGILEVGIIQHGHRTGGKQ